MYHLFGNAPPRNRSPPQTLSAMLKHIKQTLKPLRKVGKRCCRRLRNRVSDLTRRNDRLKAHHEQRRDSLDPEVETTCTKDTKPQTSHASPWALAKELCVDRTRCDHRISTSWSVDPAPKRALGTQVLLRRRNSREPGGLVDERCLRASRRGWKEE